MSKKRFSIAIIASLFIIILFSACSRIDNNIANNTIKETVESKTLLSSTDKLSANFTIDKIKSAFLEYINYHLWLDPAEVFDSTSDKYFDNYINKKIDVEIRVYNIGNDKVVYAYTNVGIWLAVFREKNGFIYCDGLINEDEELYPKEKDYTIIENYSVTIPEPHKPEYGHSERKDKMVAAFETELKSALSNLYKNADGTFNKEWENVDVYLAEFYEYEIGTNAWICKQDGSIVSYPVIFEEKNNEISVQPVKGFTVENKESLGRLYELHFEKNTSSDLIKHFKYNVK